MPPRNTNPIVLNDYRNNIWKRTDLSLYHFTQKYSGYRYLYFPIGRHLIKSLVRHHKKGYPKQEPKRLLKTSQISKPKDNHRVSADSPTRLKPASQRLSASPRPPRRGPLVPRPHSTRPQTSYRFSDSPEAPRVKPRTKYRFSDSLEAGSATTSSPPPRPTSLTKRHASNHSRDVSRTWAQYSRVADGT